MAIAPTQTGGNGARAGFAPVDSLETTGGHAI